ncbi:ABC transporter permease [Candidatus Pacearchaeota archaeon]|nr:ABC transporter permease [Candidatus Pacearchaeota archaeon]
MIKNYFSLAMSDLRHRGLRSWLTLLGIFIGIAAVVSLITLGSGLERAITGQFGGLSLDVLTIQNKQTGFAPPGSAVVEKLNNNDLKIIEEVSGVRNTITRLIRVTSVEYNKVSRFVYVGDLPQDEEDADVVYDVIDARIGEGRLLRNDDKSKIMLGSEIAKENIFEKKIRVGSKLRINGRNFEVIGILEPASTFAVNGAILMPNRDMKETLGIGDEYDLIVAKVHEEDNIEKVASEIEKKMRKDRNEKFGEESFSVETPLQALESVSTILDIVKCLLQCLKEQRILE